MLHCFLAKFCIYSEGIYHNVFPVKLSSQKPEPDSNRQLFISSE
ncbi:hypothetical protein MVUOKPPV_CDS0141 [Klebsiella phage phi1_175008]|uniref:Uncharacterized protein n=1 Tax=Klebsiella phage phi1_175008 TaxID=3127744 RepID=A0ACD5FS14_9CAUD